MNEKVCCVTFEDNGSVRSIYHDEIFSGRTDLEIERVTNVEFDNESQEWVAKLAANGEEIARGKVRDQVIADEIKVIGEMIFNKKIKTK